MATNTLNAKCAYDEYGAITLCAGLTSVTEIDGPTVKGLTRQVALNINAQVADSSKAKLRVTAILLRHSKAWAARLNFCPVCGEPLHREASRGEGRA